MMMNGWFLAAGALLAAAFFVHVFSGNRFYSAARPDAATAPSGAYEAWLMGRCGVQMISVDLFLCAAFLLLLVWSSCLFKRLKISIGLSNISWAIRLAVSSFFKLGLTYRSSLSHAFSILTFVVLLSS